MTKTLPETTSKISPIYGQGVITNRQDKNWLSVFPSGDMLLR